jgi:hypothetical protein
MEGNAVHGVNNPGCIYLFAKGIAIDGAGGLR